MLSPQEANKLLKEDKGQIVDIRTVGEVLNGEIEQSIYLPFDLLGTEKLREAGLGNKTPILVCHVGIRAKQAAKALAEELNNVAVLDGGIVAWKKEGLPMREGHYVIPLERQVLVGAGSMILLFTLLGLLVSPVFLGLTILMTFGMIFAGVSGACGMARILIMMPWNKKPLCGQACTMSEASKAGA